ncbi:MAG: low temperature requirement protein A [Actinomycetota bacterium]
MSEEAKVTPIELFFDLVFVFSLMQDHELSDPLELLPLGALYGGVALYLIAHVAFRYRNVRSLNVQRVVIAALLALIPLGAQMSALAALGLLAAVMIALIAFEATKFSEVRDRVRHEEDIAVSQMGGEPAAE